ncbi:hypothetical protein [Vibrio parahaemolyticus]|uniref:hypothetical protein n=1 Tax=Vibrio parahaemolyticus TaxID=670 RepID=UPI0011218106|nr:hypothetical protein [Vibrio parahaemolyticus]
MAEMKSEQTPRVPQNQTKGNDKMRKLLIEEALVLTSELTEVYLHYKKEYQLNGNTSCQYLARSCCIIIEGMVDKQSTKLKKHIERCLIAIASRDNLNSGQGECVSKLKLYDGEIPHILSGLEQAYRRIPTEIKNLDLQYNNRQALRGFLDDVHRTLQGCNHQERFDKPSFMNIK